MCANSICPKCKSKKIRFDELSNKFLCIDCSEISDMNNKSWQSTSFLGAFKELIDAFKRLFYEIIYSLKKSINSLNG